MLGQYSHPNYGMFIWGGSSIKNLSHVLILQKKMAIRIIADLGQRDSCREVFKNWNVLTATYRAFQFFFMHTENN